LVAPYFKLIVSFFSSTAASAMHVVASLVQALEYSADLSFGYYVALLFLAVLYIFLVVATFFLYRKQLQRHQELESSIKLLQGELDKKDKRIIEKDRSLVECARELEASANRAVLYVFLVVVTFFLYRKQLQRQQELESSIKLLQRKLDKKDVECANRVEVLQGQVYEKDAQLIEKHQSLVDCAGALEAATHRAQEKRAKECKQKLLQRLAQVQEESRQTIELAKNDIALSAEQQGGGVDGGLGGSSDAGALQPNQQQDDHDEVDGLQNHGKDEEEDVEEDSKVADAAHVEVVATERNGL
jgi:cbb3-type cytochrome oxidase subunit 3